MADLDSSGSGLGTAPASPAEQAVLGQVPADSTGDSTALDAKIADAASSIMGANLNDPRFNVNGGGGDSAAGGAGDAGAGAGDGGVAADDAAAQAAKAEADAKTEADARAAAGDKGAEQAPKVEAAPVIVKDYSLIVQGADTTDAEGNVVPGKEYKVEKIEDLPEDFIPRHNRQVMEIIRNLDKLEATKAKDEFESATVAEQQASVAAQAKTLQSWDAEIKAMQKAGVIGEPKLKETDPNYLTDPAMVEVAKVFAFMEKTNNARRAAGNPNFITSFEDAYDKMDRADRVAKDVAAAKAEAETAKLKASVIGGGSSGAGSGEAPVYVAGQAGGDIRNLK